MNQGREDPLAFGSSDDEQTIGTAHPEQAHSDNTRSSSPAKRRASAMEDDAMDVDKSAQGQTSTTIANASGSNRPPTPSSTKSDSNQNTREGSVEITLNGHSTNPSSITNSPNHEMDEDTEIPSIDKQVETILKEVANIEDGAVGYAVSGKWINRVLARSSQSDGPESYDKDVLEGDIGPIDNYSILPSEGERDTGITDDNGDPFVQLRPGLNFSEDVQVFPQKAFDSAVKWYGLAPNQPKIKRYAHATTPDDLVDKNVQWEMYPPIYTLRKLHLAKQPAINEDDKKAPRIAASRNGRYQDFLRRAKKATGIPMASKTKIWRVIVPEAVTTESSKKSLLSPPASREASPAPTPQSVPLIIKSEAFKAMPEGQTRIAIDSKDETDNSKYNGSVDMRTLGLGADEVLILEPSGNNGFLSDTAPKNGKKGGLLSNRNSPRLGPTTRGRNRLNNRSEATVGLTNLGNTCYMNSALQCIRAAEELTCFFLTKQWQKELNKSNPLGYEGRMASTYASLVDSIHKTSSTSFTPSDFKRVLSKCGPQFSGYGQQDSQEFMSFLVDALHEDMNRIINKPYIENPDSDDNRIHDKEYVKELGNTYRENYRKRNDSVIHDLFNGFYKNTMVCPSCEKVSVTFDPYLLLTLQLPLEHSWQHTLIFWPLKGEPVKIEIDMDKTSTIRQLKEYVASKIKGQDAKRLMMAEIFGKKIYRTVEDKQAIMEANIQPRDDMYIYELDEPPSNFPTKKKKKFSMLLDNSEDEDIPDQDSPLADRMLVPVFHRAKTSTYGTSKNLALTPFFITINREENRSFEEIYRKVLARVASMTTRDFLSEDGALDAEESDADENEEKPVMTTEEDAESNTDMQARSVESEEGMVEVSMTNNDQVESAGADLGRDRRANPVLTPGKEIPPTLFQLFDLRYMEAGTEMIPTGHMNVDSRATKPLFSKLQRKMPPPPSDVEDGSTPNSSESSDVDEPPAQIVQPSFIDGTGSESDEGFSRVKDTRNRKMKTYGRKGNNKFNNNKQQNRFARQTTEEPDDGTLFDFEWQTDGPILKLGESLVLDWTENGYDALFCGVDEEDFRGSETLGKDTPVLEDKELNEKRKKRSERKKNGIILDDCFKVTAQGEILTEDNAWYCNRCKELRRAEKTLEIWTAPDILVIHLKRFSAARQFRDKIDILVDFPVEGLNLNDRVGLKEDGKDLTYDLFAVDNHYGGLGGGHYTAYAKNFMDEQWYEYNDSSSQKRTANSVVTPAAYLLFYRRRTGGYLGPKDLQDLVSTYRNPEEEVEDSGMEVEDDEDTEGSGKGPRLGGSFLSGSAGSQGGSPSVAVGAGRLSRRGGDGSGEAARGLGPGAGARRGLAVVGENGTEGYEADEDEAVADMGSDVDDPLPGGAAGAMIGPHLPPPQYGDTAGTVGVSAYQDWSFAGLTGRRFDDDHTYQGIPLGGGLANHSDNDSNAAVGDDYNDDGDVRMMTDFGDETMGGSGPNVSPVVQSTEMDTMLEDVVPLLADDGMDEDHVAEIHPGDLSPLPGSGSGTAHEKAE